jgi:hypothetical protein
MATMASSFPFANSTNEVNPAVVAEVATKKKRSTNTWGEYYKNKDGREWLTKAEHDAALLEIAHKEVNGNKANKLTLKPGPEWADKEAEFKKYRCPYFNRTKPKCPRVFKSEHNLSIVTIECYRIQFGEAKHIDHGEAWCGKGAKPTVREKIDVLSMKQGPKALVGELTDELNLDWSAHLCEEKEGGFRVRCQYF